MLENSFLNRFFIILSCLAYSALGGSWHWDGSGCGSDCTVACPPFCYTCQTNLICETCVEGYGLYPQDAYGSTNRQYVKCPDNFYLDTGTKHCEYCPTGCAVCTDATDCTSCGNSYYLQADGSCSTSCPDGYFKSSRYCVECPEPCKKCTSGSVCTECNPGFGLRNDQCLDCPTGTYLIGGNCVVCPANCATCTDASTCQSCTMGAYLYNSACGTTCPIGYYATETFCMQCPASCATCTSISACQTCNSGWGLLDGACDNCPDGYYLSGTTCQVCSSGCAVCSSSTICEKCQSGFALEGAICVTCPRGKFAASGICVDCPVTCIECTDASTCQSCVEGYGLTKGQCADCPSTMYFLNGQCVANNLTSQALSNTTTRITTVTTTVSSVVSIGSSNPLTFGLMSKTIEKIRFLQIGYPIELEDVFLSWNVDLYSIQIPDKIAEQLIARDTPEIFSIYGIDSTFLMNYWNDMMIIGVCLLLLLFLRILEILFPKKPKETFFDVWLLKIRLMVQNFLVVQVYGAFGDIAFYFILEMKTLKFASTTSAVSFVVSILFLITGLLLLAVQIWILISYQKKKKESEQALQRFCAKYSAFGVLFLEFKDTTTLSQAYMTVLILRDIITSVVSIAMTSSPYAQAIMFFSCSVLMWLYLIFKNPFEGYYERLIQYLMEALLLTVNVCVLVLAHMDEKNQVETATRERLGKAIITSNFILNIVAIFCLAIQLLQISFAIYRVIQVIIKHYRKPKGTPNDVQNLDTALNEVLHQMRRPLAVRKPRILRNPSFETSEELSLDSSPQANRRNNSREKRSKTLMYLYKHNKEFKKAIEDIRLGGRWR